MSADGESERKSKKKSHKSKHRDMEFDQDYVDKTVRKAMKEVDKAMGQVKLAEKASKRAQKKSGRETHGETNGEYYAGAYRENVHINTGTIPDGVDGTGPAYYQNNVQNIAGNFIHIENAQNVQVGSHNVMVVNDKDRKFRRSSRKSQSDYSSDEEQTDKPDTPQKDPADMTDAERRIYNLLHCPRLVTPLDMDNVSQHVGNWRRLLRHLDLDDALLEQIHQDLHAEGVRSIVVEGLQQWKRKEADNATVGALAQALKKTGYMDAASCLMEA